MWSALAAYAKAVPARPHWVAGILLLAAAGTLLEGAALVLLIPLIQIGAGGGLEDPSLAVRLLVDALQMLGLPLSVPALLAAFAVVAFLSSCLVWLANTGIFRLIAATDARMRRQLFDAALGMSWPALSAERTGDVLKSLQSDPVQTGTGLSNLLMAATAAVATLAYLAVACLLSWRMTLLTLVFAVAVLPIYVAQVRRGRHAAAAASRHEEEMLGRGAETVAAAKYLLSQGMRESAQARFAASVEQYRRARFRQDMRVELSRLVFELTAICFVVGFLFLAVTVVELPLTSSLVFIAIFYRLAPKVVTVQGCLFRAVNYAAWAESWRARVEGYRRRAAPARRGTLEPVFARELALSGVSFRYPSKDEAALDGVSLRLGRGECLALVGPSGHGKSTLIDVITGLLSPDAGEVTLDGRPLGDYDLQRWQRMVGLVPQDAPLLNATVRENVVFDPGEPPDPARLDWALRLAEAAEFVAALPQGLDTPVGERGAQLSGGQRQRLALARALYRRPRLLILDEATSALDAATARRVVQNLKSLKGETAMLIVSHAPELLELADRTMRVEFGRAAESPAAAHERAR